MNTICTGPLARTEIGEDNIQGVDYAYTIEGFLKSINQVHLDPSKDLGGDGQTPDGFLPDEFAMELGYYQNDYTRTGTDIGADNAATDPFANGTITTSPKDRNSLYNGNISFWTSNLRSGSASSSVPVENPMTVKTNIYKYDKLNRLRNVDFKKFEGGGVY